LMFLFRRISSDFQISVFSSKSKLVPTYTYNFEKNMQEGNRGNLKI
jgi:hypothetical protein